MRNLANSPIDHRRKPAKENLAPSKSSGLLELPPMADQDFAKLSSLIQSRCGIFIQLSKKYLLEGRLRKRVVQLHLQTYRQYIDHLSTEKGAQEEMPFMIDAVTTNKTDFFREPHQFDYLLRQALPQLALERKKYPDKCRLWSAACSTGEEPYTLAILLSEYALSHLGFDFHILATDISTKVLSDAVRGIYPHEKIEPIPQGLRKKYLLRSKDSQGDLVKIHPEVQKKITFRHLNLMESSYGFSGAMDIIFCRNVIIYFDRPTQLSLVRRLCQNLSPAGYLFMGHSEVLTNTDLPLSPVAPSVYRKT